MPVLSSWRPQQPRVVEQLSQALRSGRLHHALLFQGSPATPLTALGHALAQTLVCQAPKDVDACGTCAACRKMLGGNHPDIHTLSPNEKGVIAVQAVRGLAERLSLRASESKIKVALIEGAEAMPPGAQNALLKTLEEPPGDTCFIVLTRRTGALLGTIRSRCQHLRLRAPQGDVATQALIAAGIDAPLAARLSPFTGDDAALAQAYVDAGAADIEAAFDSALATDAPLQTVFRVAADLGGDKERCELAMHLFEVRLRDAMAAQPSAALAYTAGVVQRLRRAQSLHINRAMALEGLFLAWTGRFKAASESALVDL